MSIDEEQQLTRIVQTHKVMWIPPSYDTARHVLAIRRRPDEYSMPCAQFDRGEYVVLFNCDINDFFIVQPIPKEDRRLDNDL